MPTKNLKLMLARRTSRKRGKAEEVWVHPDLSRMLKGADHKLSSDQAEQYWMDRQSRRPFTED